MIKYILGCLAATMLLFVALMCLQSNNVPDDKLIIVPEPASSPEPTSSSRGPAASPVVSVKKDGVIEKITLSKSNTVTLRTEVTGDTTDKAAKRLIELSHEDPRRTLYLVLDTPGGSVDATLALIDTLQALPNPIHTVTLFSASMGFHIVQRLKGRRLITPNGVLMSHRMSINGLEGDFPGSAVVRMNYMLRDSNREDEKISARMKMSVDEYTQLIKDEYWVRGQDAVNAKAADAVVLISCDASLDGTSPELMTIDTPKGMFMVTFSECPLLRSPVTAEPASKGFTTGIFIQNLLYDKASFVTDYIVN